MALDLALLDIQKVILHDVGRQVDSSQEPPIVFSEIDSALTSELKGIIKDRIIDGAGPKSASAAQLDDEAVGPVGPLVYDLLHGKSEGFVEASKVMARHLYESQSHVSPAGLLAVVLCVIGGVPALAIMKLDRNAGIQLRSEKRDGHPTFDLAVLKDLIITGNTRLQKLALFAADDDSEGGVWGRVCDRQRGFTGGLEVAQFFLNRFLGCKFVGDSPPIVTARLLEATHSYINTVVSDPVTKANYETAILAELNNQHGVISPEDFAEVHLQPADRQPFLDHLAEHGVPSTVFDKDVTNLGPRLKRVFFRMNNGVVVSAPSDQANELVLVQKLDNGQTQLSTRGYLDSVGSSG